MELELEYMTRMELLLPTSVMPFRVTLDEPMTECFMWRWSWMSRKLVRIWI